MEKLNEQIRLDCARRSWAAEQERREIEMFTLTYPELDREEGYKIQELRHQLVLEAGHRLVGYKLGSTSMSKRLQMGTSTSSYGRLYDYMLLTPGCPLELDSLIHPKLEPEITFFLKEDLTGPYVTAPQVMAATDYVVGSFEVIDSRYVDFKFTGGDVVSDNISGGRFLLGETKLKPNELDLALLGVRLSVNGNDIAYATGSEVLGHPARAVAEFVNLFYKRAGRSIHSGEFVMTGGITHSIVLERGDQVLARFAHLGDVALDIK